MKKYERETEKNNKKLKRITRVRNWKRDIKIETSYDFIGVVIIWEFLWLEWSVKFDHCIGKAMNSWMERVNVSSAVLCVLGWYKYCTCKLRNRFSSFWNCVLLVIYLLSSFHLIVFVFIPYCMTFTLINLFYYLSICWKKKS